MLKSFLITGANAGLGKETAKQLADKPNTKKIYLACRNRDKAIAAKQELEMTTGKFVFEIVDMDVSNPESVKAAVASLPEPVEALVMNAGGAVGSSFHELTKEGVTQIFAVNLLGHAILTEELIKANKLTKAAIYAGSEAARGVKEMGMKRPDFPSSSVDDFIGLSKGELYGSKKDATVPYGPIKYMAALWMSAMAREHKEIRFVTISPGATTGTDGFNTLSTVKRVVMKSMMQIMLMLGKVHKVEVGAKRFVDALLNTSYQSGYFYASEKGLTGVISDQSMLFADLSDTRIQDNAKAALDKVIN